MTTSSRWTVPLLLAWLAAQPAWADTELNKVAQSVLENVPPVHVRAQIVGIDAPTRTLTLRSADGDIVEVTVSDQVTRFDNLKVGEQVDVTYKDALLVAADKPGGAQKPVRERVDSMVRVPSRDGFRTVREVEVLATVEKVDQQKRLVTLRGPYRTQTFRVSPDVDLKSAKAGDVFHAVFIAAAAVEVMPVAPAPR